MLINVPLTWKMKNGFSSYLDVGDTVVGNSSHRVHSVFDTTNQTVDVGLEQADLINYKTGSQII